jgi:hypothetical protein
MIELSQTSAVYAPLESERLILAELQEKFDKSLKRFDFTGVIWDLMAKSQSHLVEKRCEWVCRIFHLLADRYFTKGSLEDRIAKASSASLVGALSHISQGRKPPAHRTISLSFTYQMEEEDMIDYARELMEIAVQESRDPIGVFGQIYWWKKSYSNSKGCAQVAIDILNTIYVEETEEKHLYKKLAKHVFSSFQKAERSHSSFLWSLPRTEGCPCTII